jgi:hypothetical protein
MQLHPNLVIALQTEHERDLRRSADRRRMLPKRDRRVPSGPRATRQRTTARGVRSWFRAFVPGNHATQ